MARDEDSDKIALSSTEVVSPGMWNIIRTSVSFRPVRQHPRPRRLAVAVTAGFQRFLGHNDKAGGVKRVHDGHGAAFANEYGHLYFTPLIRGTTCRQHFHACDNVLRCPSHFVPSSMPAEVPRQTGTLPCRLTASGPCC